MEPALRSLTAALEAFSASDVRAWPAPLPPPWLSSFTALASPENAPLQPGRVRSWLNIEKGSRRLAYNRRTLEGLAMLSTL
jgi:hypothetical protein